MIYNPYAATRRNGNQRRRFVNVPVTPLQSPTTSYPISTLETLIGDLESALKVCYNVDYQSDDHEKSSPYAVGYSRAAMQTIKDRLTTLKTQSNSKDLPFYDF
jgi:hypothetical protein